MRGGTGFQALCAPQAARQTPIEGAGAAAARRNAVAKPVWHVGGAHSHRHRTLALPQHPFSAILYSV